MVAGRVLATVFGRYPFTNPDAILGPFATAMLIAELVFVLTLPIA